MGTQTTADSTWPVGDWERAISEGGMYKNVPTYGEASLSGSVELRYHNPEPLEFNPLTDVYYEVVIRGTTYGIGNELFGEQRYDVDEGRAKELLDDHCDGKWEYVE